MRNAYIIKCNSVLKDSEGGIVKLLCEIDPETLGKNPEDRKVKGVIQWVEKTNAVKIMVREIARLFTIEKPESEEGKEFYEFFNKESSKENFAYAEPSINDLNDGNTCQFERIGYYCRDQRKEKAHGCMYFNQTVSLKGNNRF